MTNLTQSEAEKLRDRMNADQDKSTETLSTVLRSLGVGLALITYSFFIQKDQSKFLVDNFPTLKYASMLGVAALSADALQYLFALLQVRSMRWQIKRQTQATGTLTLAQLSSFTRNPFYYLRDLMFWAKLVFVAAGTAIVIESVLAAATISSVTTPGSVAAPG